MKLIEPNKRLIVISSIFGNIGPTLRGRGASEHRYTDDNSVTVTAASITQTITGDSEFAKINEFTQDFRYQRAYSNMACFAKHK